MEAINGWIKAELFTDFHVTGNRDVALEVDSGLYSGLYCGFFSH